MPHCPRCGAPQGQRSPGQRLPGRSAPYSWGGPEREPDWQLPARGWRLALLLGTLFLALVVTATSFYQIGSWGAPIPSSEAETKTSVELRREERRQRREEAEAEEGAYDSGWTEEYTSDSYGFPAGDSSPYWPEIAHVNPIYFGAIEQGDALYQLDGPKGDGWQRILMQSAEWGSAQLVLEADEEKGELIGGFALSLDSIYYSLLTPGADTAAYYKAPLQGGWGEKLFDGPAGRFVCRDGALYIWNTAGGGLAVWELFGSGQGSLHTIEIPLTAEDSTFYPDAFSVMDSTLYYGESTGKRLEYFAYDWKAGERRAVLRCGESASASFPVFDGEYAYCILEDKTDRRIVQTEIGADVAYASLYNQYASVGEDAAFGLRGPGELIYFDGDEINVTSTEYYAPEIVFEDDSLSAITRNWIVGESAAMWQKDGLTHQFSNVYGSGMIRTSPLETGVPALVFEDCDALAPYLAWMAMESGLAEEETYDDFLPEIRILFESPEMRETFLEEDGRLRMDIFSTFLEEAFYYDFYYDEVEALIDADGISGFILEEDGIYLDDSWTPETQRPELTFVQRSEEGYYVDTYLYTVQMDEETQAVFWISGLEMYGGFYAGFWAESMGWTTSEDALDGLESGSVI